MPDRENVLYRILNIYKLAFSRYRFLFIVTAVVYLAFFVVFFAKGSLVEFFRATFEVKQLRTRVLELETERHQQEQLLATLSSRTSQADFLKPLKFEEKWRDEAARQNVSRLVDYAEFAVSKNDYEHAERFYSEADNIQPTVTIPYYEGRLAYRRGDLQLAEAKWLEAIKRDSGNKYPDLRLYLGLLYYQMGRSGEAQQFLKNYSMS